MAKSKAARNHHFVPQLYLKGFATPDHPMMIWCYKRGAPFDPGTGKNTSNPYCVSIRDAGMQRDFYAKRHRDGTVDFAAVETELQRRERKADHAFREVRDLRSLSKNDRDRLAAYMVLMWKRTPKHKAESIGSWPELVAEQLEEWRTAFTERERMVAGLPNADDELMRLTRVRAEVERLMAEHQINGMPDEIRYDGMLGDSPLVSLAIRSMRWTYFIAPDGLHFITCDDPLFIFRGLGLNKPESEITFPMSSRVALVGSWNLHEPEQFVTATPEIVAEVNHRMVVNADRFVYGCEASEAIGDLFNAPPEGHWLLHDPKDAAIPSHITSA